MVSPFPKPSPPTPYPSLARFDSAPGHLVLTSHKSDDGDWTAEVDVSNVPRFEYEVRKFE